MSVLPWPSITCAPAGTCAFAPTATMRPRCITTVLPVCGRAPVPSITVTLVIATTGLSTLMNGRSDVSGRVCATSAGGTDRARARVAASIVVSVRMASPRREGEGSTSIDGDRGHHAGLEVLRDVAMQHPRAGVRKVNQQIDGGARGH